MRVCVYLFSYLSIYLFYFSKTKVQHVSGLDWQWIFQWKHERTGNTNEKDEKNENISDKKTPKQTPTSVGVENMPKKRKKRLENPLFFWLSLGFREWDNLHLVVNWENKPDDQKKYKNWFSLFLFRLSTSKIRRKWWKKEWENEN